MAAALLLPLLASCSDDSPASSAGLGAEGRNIDTLNGTVTVLAASSLTESFNDMGRRFQTVHPQVSVAFSYGASSTLVAQANAGAPADVLATADEATMAQAVRAGSVTKSEVFARNRLAILVAKGNPKGVRTLADLARPDMVVVLCAAEVPCGKFGAEALAKASVRVTPRSFEANVKGVVSKVTLGEADAGIVYVSDVKAAGDKAEGVTIPDEQNVVANYAIALLKTPQNGPAAAAFVAFVRSDEGKQVLAAAGFSD